jgi:hypothetical protein
MISHRSTLFLLGHFANKNRDRPRATTILAVETWPDFGSISRVIDPPQQNLLAGDRSHDGMQFLSSIGRSSYAGDRQT